MVFDTEHFLWSILLTYCSIISSLFFDILIKQKRYKINLLYLSHTAYVYIRHQHPEI